MRGLSADPTWTAIIYCDLFGSAIAAAHHLALAAEEAGWLSQAELS
jgi:hypothetical protein